MTSNPKSLVTNEVQELNSTIALDELIEILRRRIGLLVSCVTISLMLGAAYYLKAERIYEVTSRLLIQYQELPLDLRTTPYRYNEEFLATQAQIILSPAVIEPAVRASKWQPAQPSANGPVASVLSSLTVAPVSNTDIINIAFRSPQPTEDITVVEELITYYQRFLGDLKQDTYGETHRLLTRTEKDLRTDLEELEARYHALREEGAVVGQGKDAERIFQVRLADLADEVNQARISRLELESRLQSFASETPKQLTVANPIMPISLAALQRDEQPHKRVAERMPTTDLAALVPLHNRVPGRGRDSIDMNLEDIRMELFRGEDEVRELETKYGPRHPSVLAAHHAVEAWESRLREQISSVPLVLQREVELAREHEYSLAKLYEEEFAKAQHVDSRLLKEQQALAAVERVQEIHDSISSQLRHLQLEGEAAANGHSGVKVTVLARPQVSPSPVWPSLPLIMGVCGLLGLILGGGITGMLERNASWMRPSV